MNHILHTLRDNLLRCYIYYIPDSIFDDLNKTALQGIINRSDLNTLGFFDNNINSSTNFNNLNTVDFVTKSNQLEDNILALFKAKEELHDTEFQYILGNYKEHVGSHAFITDFLQRNLSHYIKNVDPHIISLFQMQMQVFDTHLIKMRQLFGAIEKPKTYRDQYLLNQFKDKFSKPGLKIKVPAVKSTLKPPNKTVNKLKTKKKPLITNEEADAFLMETVFNIKNN